MRQQTSQQTSATHLVSGQQRLALARHWPSRLPVRQEQAQRRAVDSLQPLLGHARWGAEQLCRNRRARGQQCSKEPRGATCWRCLQMQEPKPPCCPPATTASKLSLALHSRPSWRCVVPSGSLMPCCSSAATFSALAGSSNCLACRPCCTSADRLPPAAPAAAMSPPNARPARREGETCGQHAIEQDSAL